MVSLNNKSLFLHKKYPNMKKSIFIILLQLFCISSFSQTSSDSLLFIRDFIAKKTDKFLTVKGIELKPGLKMNDMLDQLLKNGFKKSEFFNSTKEQYGAYDLIGTFFNCANCKLKIIPTNTDKSIVGIIGINFPESTSFKELKNKYLNLKSALSDKYYTFSSDERFDNEYVDKSTSDILKLNALERNEAIFESRFYATNAPLSILLGQVILKIDHINVNYEPTSYISLIYCTSDRVIEEYISSENDL